MCIHVGFCAPNRINTVPVKTCFTSTKLAFSPITHAGPPVQWLPKSCVLLRRGGTFLQNCGEVMKTVNSTVFMTVGHSPRQPSCILLLCEIMLIWTSLFAFCWSCFKMLAVNFASVFCFCFFWGGVPISTDYNPSFVSRRRRWNPFHFRLPSVWRYQRRPSCIKSATKKPNSKQFSGVIAAWKCTESDKVYSGRINAKTGHNSN